MAIEIWEPNTDKPEPLRLRLVQVGNSVFLRAVRTGGGVAANILRINGDGVAISPSADQAYHCALGSMIPIACDATGRVKVIGHTANDAETEGEE